MRRRHLLALVILALVVATVLAVGPMRVWDAVTLRTVEEHWPNGQLKRRYQRQWWSGDGVYNHVGSWEEWHEDGQPADQIIANSLGNGYAKLWSREGDLIAYHSMQRGEAHTDSRTNLARCFRCKRNFNPVDLTMIVTRASFLEAIEQLVEEPRNGLRRHR